MMQQLISRDEVRLSRWTKNTYWHEALRRPVT